MAEYTENYNLKKPAQEDFYNIDDQNHNMDQIDAALKGKADLGPDGKIRQEQLPASISDPTEAIENAIREHDASGTAHSDIRNLLSSHTENGEIHVTSSDKTAWNGKETPEGAQAKADAARDAAIAASDSKGSAAAVQEDLTAHTEDADIHVTAANKVFPLTHAKSDAVHALTGLAGVSGTVSCIFMATANFAAGDTFTVDGEPYVLQLCNGEAAEDNLFVSGAYVPIIVDMAGKKVNFKAGGEKKELTTDIITFTQNWTVPKGVKTVVVRIFGGGGGGGNNVNGGGGGAGGSMAYQEISVTPEQVIPVTIATASSGNGGPSSFGSYLSASGGGAASGVGGGTGGTGGGGGHGGVGGDASYGGGGGGGINGRGGNGGTYGGGGGGGGPYGSQEANGKAGGTGGTYGGDGGKGRTSGEPGTNTIGMGLEFEGAGAGGSSAANEGGAGGGGGGYGGNGGRGNRLGGGAGGGGGYGGNGGNGTNNDGGGGGGYGGNGGSGGGYGGGGGGGYGSAGNGGNGGASGGTGGSGGLAAGGGGADSSARRGAGGPGVCIITYMK